MGEVRKWEDMEYDCLIQILGSVGLLSLLRSVPFVCKSWHKASLTPSIWKRINGHEFFDYRFGFLSYEIAVKKIPGLFKLVVSRGQGTTTSLVLPIVCNEKDLEYVAEKCPELKELSLLKGDSALVNLIPKWKRLELLSCRFSSSGVLPKVVAQIEKNCENFTTLELQFYRLDNKDSSAIAKHLPKTKRLWLNYCGAEDLEILVLGCKELEVLKVDRYECGDNWNEEKLKELTSHIKTVNVFEPRLLRSYRS